jgi:hypothetical protein
METFMRITSSIGVLMALSCIASCASPPTTTVTESAQQTRPHGEEVPIVEQKSLPYSGFERGFNVARDDDVQAYQRWLDAPVDPSNEQILVAGMGPRRTGGYQINVERVIETEDGVWVEVSQTGPDSNCHVTMAETEPGHLAVIPRSDKPVEFVVRPLEHRPCN